nr:Beta-galactosidase [Kibdelosporangium sp. MJ126-NF4]CTQ92572.1 Beta-galactosidase (EC 3.2.1.23) [Kibdelosporangium sp. MJ126-NF4]
MRLRRVLVAGLTAVTAGSVLTVVGSSVPLTGPRIVDTVAEAADAPNAVRLARLQGTRVEVVAERTPTRAVYANPGGTMTAELSVVPQRVKQGNQWVGVDTTMVRRPDGKVGPKAVLGELTLSGGGSGDALATMRMDGRTFAVHWPGPLPAPVLDSNKATYSEVLPGVDLVMIAERGGYQQHVVIKNPAAARNPALASIRLGVDAPGLTVTADDHGGLHAVDDKGTEIFKAPNPMMWDSSGPAPSGPATSKSTEVDVSVVDGSIVIRPDQRFLADPAVVYPVVVDPPWSPPGRQAWATVLSGKPTQKYWWTSGDHPWAQMGQCPRDLHPNTCNNIGEAWAYFQFDTTFLADKPVIEASFDTSVVYSPSCEPNRAYEVYHAPGDIWDGMTWNNRLQGGRIAHNTAPVVYSGCPGWKTVGVGIAANEVEQHSFSTYFLKADPNDQHAWRKLDPGNTMLRVFYNRPPSAPTDHSTDPPLQQPCANCGGITYVGDDNIRVSARLSDPDADMVDANWQIAVDGAAGNTGWLGQMQSSGAFHSWNIPLGDKNGKRIDWAVMGGDGRAASGWASSNRPFVVDRVGVTKQPTVTGVLYQEDNRWHGGVGVPGTFVFGANGVDDIDHYLYSWEDPNGGQGVPSTKVNADRLGGNASVQITPTVDGPRDLYVQSVDRAGHRGPVRVYRIYVRAGNGPLAQWPLDGNAKDTAFLGDRHGTLGGGATFTAQGAVGSAIELDGNDDHVTAPNAIRNDAGFTVSAWVNLKTDRYARAAVSQDGTMFPGFALWFRAEPDGTKQRWSFGVPNSTSANQGVQMAESPIGMPQQNTWTHLTGVRDPGAKQVRLYVNGQLVSTVAQTAMPDFAAGPVRIGRTMFAGNPAVDPWQGGVDEVQLYDRVLTDSEIAASVGQANVQIGHWKFEEPTGATAGNSIEGGADGVLTGGAGFDSQGATGRALKLNGIDGAMTTNGSVVRTDQSFSVAAWVRADRFVADGKSMTAVSQDGNAYSGFYLQYSSANGGKWMFARPGVDTAGASQGWIGVPASQQPKSGDWVHLTGSFDAATRQMRVYVNGELGGTGTMPGAPWNATGPFTVGRGKFNSAPADFWPGLVDEVRVYSRVLSEDEVRGIVTRDNVTAGEWKLDGNANDSSKRGLHGTVSAGADWASGQATSPDPGDMAVRLNGTNGYVSAPNAIDTDKSFSVSAWARLDRIGSASSVVSQDGEHVSGFALRALADGRWDFLVPGADQVAAGDQATGPAAQRGIWTHLVGVYSKDRKRIELYVNGVLAASAAHEGGFDANKMLQIGRSKWADNGNVELFQGAIDDVTVYNRSLFAAEIATMAGRDVSLGHNWTMDEGAGNVAGDSVGAKGVTLQNGAGFGAGRAGNALKFDGVNDIATAQGVDVRTDASFTVSAWVNLEANDCAEPRCFVSAVSLEGGAGKPTKFRLGHVKDADSGQAGNWIFEMPEPDGTTTKAALDVRIGEINNWVHLTGVYDAAAKAIWVYVDGTRKDDGTLLTSWQGAGQLRVGSGTADGRAQYWKGRVDDVRLYAGALTADRISALHRSYPSQDGPVTLPPPDAGHWKFDEDSGTTALDTSGRGLNATMRGGASRYAGRIGYTGWFDGKTGFAETAGPVLNTEESFSVAGWAYIDDFTKQVTVFGQDGQQVSTFQVQLDPSSRRWVAVVPRTDQANPERVTLASADPAVGGWSHLAVVYDKNLSQLKLYVNGILSGVQVGVSVRASTGPLAIARCKWNGANGCFFTRGVDDVRAYRKALSDGEVRGVHDETPAVPYGHWRFDDGTVKDYSWRQIPTTLSGTASFPTGVVGKALELDGSTGSATAAQPGLMMYDSFTVSAWARLTRTDRVSTVFSQEGGRQSAVALQYRPEVGRWVFGGAEQDQDGSPMVYANSLQPPALGKWTHLTGVYDAPIRQLRLYVDGQHVGTKNNVLLWAANGFAIGRGKENGSPSGFFSGTIDELMTDYGVVDAEGIATRANWPAPAGGQLSRLNLVGGGEHRSAYSANAFTDKLDPVPAGYRFEIPLGMMLTGERAGTRRLYSCLRDNSDSFTSAAADCEGHTKLGDLGWAYTEKPAGIASVPLYRCIDGTERFDSNLSTCEGRTADGQLGYLVGYAALSRYHHGERGDHMVTTGDVYPGYRREFTLGLLAMTEEPGTAAVMSCSDAMDHFLSTDPACEGKTVHRSIGRVWTAPPDGQSSVQLQRCAVASGALAGQRFVSANATCEGQTVVGPLGYALTAVPGPLRP